MRDIDDRVAELQIEPGVSSTCSSMLDTSPEPAVPVLAAQAPRLSGCSCFTLGLGVAGVAGGVRRATSAPTCSAIWRRRRSRAVGR